MDLENTLAAFFRSRAPLVPGDRVLVAFSGGPDSSALLAAMCEFARDRALGVLAAHVDHQLDPESRDRSEAAADAATKLGLELVVRRRNVRARRRRSESLEMAARRVRYQELERVAGEAGARYIATAHHRDDQVETMLLRLAGGHGLSALGAIPARRGMIVRPLLRQARSELLAYARSRGLAWVEDSTNADLRVPRNRVRRVLLPALESRQPGLARRLADLAEAASGANARLGRALDRRLAARREGSEISVSRETLEKLPAAVLPHAVVHLLRSLGSYRRPSRTVLARLGELLARRSRVGVDLGGGWRIEDGPGGRLRLFRPPEPTPRFAYNLTAPGRVRLGELASTIRLEASSVKPWMFRGNRRRTGLQLRLGDGQRLTVRNRRPGDRVQPFGSSSLKKLKDLLIDHGIPRHERDRLPLLCHSGRIVWVPGVTIDHEARIRPATAGNAQVWVAEIIPDD